MQLIACPGARGAAAVALFAVLSIVPSAGAQTTTDYTEYTYSVRAGSIGSSASQTITRTFDAPISSLRLFIVSGQADDIGYVGSRLVTSVQGQCAGVGAVTSEQEVTDQVTISGNTATFVLRAQENCCCVTGWGSATQGDRANARFRWVVTLGAECDVAPLTPVTDPDAAAFEAGNTVNTAGLVATMQSALICLQEAAAAAGGSLTVTSAYRPASYQQHLREVWDRWNELRNNRDPGCEERKADAQAEFQRHGLLLSQRPAASSAHTRGQAFDARWNLPPGTNIDSLAATCDLHRPFRNDPVHFILR